MISARQFGRREEDRSNECGNLPGERETTWNEAVEMRARLQMKSVSNLSTGAWCHLEIEGHWETFTSRFANEPQVALGENVVSIPTGQHHSVDVVHSGKWMVWKPARRAGDHLE